MACRVFFWYVILLWPLISCTRKESRGEAENSRPAHTTYDHETGRWKWDLAMKGRWYIRPAAIRALNYLELKLYSRRFSKIIQNGLALGSQRFCSVRGTMELLRCRHRMWPVRMTTLAGAKIWHLIDIFIVCRFNLNLENIIGLALQTRPFERLRIGLATQNHFSAPNHNRHLVNRGSLMTSDSNSRRREPLGHKSGLLPDIKSQRLSEFVETASTRRCYSSHRKSSNRTRKEELRRKASQAPSANKSAMPSRSIPILPNAQSGISVSVF